MTTQEVYEAQRRFFKEDAICFAVVDKVVENDSDEAPIDAETICVYRGDNDPKSPVRCAIGCVLPDELYTAGMEENSVTQVIGTYDAVAELFEGVDEQYLEESQRAHDLMAEDGCTTLDEFVVRLDQLAKRFCLEVVAS